ncbi:putative hydroxymethylpyrimidine transporter CytX [Dellaglioa sp. BT-FLS60]
MSEPKELRSQFLIWLGAAISIAEIMTGMLLAPLGFLNGFWAILIGHLIGCGLFLLPAGYIGAKRHQTAIQSTKIAFGSTGVLLFSLINLVQLIGWTAVMIVNAISAMNGVSNALFSFKNTIIMGLIMAIGIIIWLLVGKSNLYRINLIVVSLLVIGAAVMLFLIFKTPVSTSSHLGQMTFGSAVELNITMALSWLPLIGDYTKATKYPIALSSISSLGYFAGSLIMFTIGLFLTTRTGFTDFTSFLATSGLGIIALFIIIFSTVTTTFLDVLSATINIQNIHPIKRVKLMSILIVIMGLLIAWLVPIDRYQTFLYFIASVFTPLYTIVFVTYFVTKKTLPYWLNLIWWVIGIFAYYPLQQLDFSLGTTVIILFGLGLFIYLTQLILPNHYLKKID